VWQEAPELVAPADKGAKEHPELLTVAVRTLGHRDPLAVPVYKALLGQPETQG